ncbi:MAG: hypothetical protein R3320_12165 [Nitriliruptorales bacterium]|nr:hypothetical protein [Nitriliruptorales bacterium]
MGSFIASFSTDLAWDELGRWPADVFAVTNLVLDHTEAYRIAVSPTEGGRWPPDEDWQDRVTTAAAEWRDTAGADRRSSDLPAPSTVSHQWRMLGENLDVPIEALRHGDVPQLCEALVTLHAVADEVHRGLAGVHTEELGQFEEHAQALLDNRGSLSRIEPRRVRVTPKTHFPSRGLTIRSFSRYLALNYESIDLRWCRVEVGEGNWVEGRQFHQVLLPWPLTVDADAFASVEGPIGVDQEAFGFFAYRPETPLDLDLVSELLGAAKSNVERVDSLILPEAALSVEEIGPLEELLADAGVDALVAGTRSSSIHGRLSRNYVHLGFRTPDGWIHREQDKHHRWCLDPPQIRQYHLTRALSPTKRWWEAIELAPRRVEVIDTGGGATMVPLICEDLARLDEVADVLRRIGPSFVVGLLLDGPQLSHRWSCRYAAVLADDPGSSVLTLTSMGMVARSRPPETPPSRTVAMWSDPQTGVRQIDLERGASAVLITSTVEPTPAWTADGPRHETGVPASVLTSVTQLRTRSRKGRSRHAA